jgi:hypothetical protein
MQELSVKHLGMAISSLLLSGCSPEPVSDAAPEPYYPSCETVRHLAKETTPDAVWQDVKNMVTVMEQLRETMPPDERPQFGKCKP